MFESFHKLTTTGLKDLAALCRQHQGIHPPSPHALHQLAGATLGDELGRCLRALLAQGWTSDQLALVADSLAAERLAVTGPEQLIDIVLSGPDAPGVSTRDTAAVMHSLLADATREVLLVGYAVHNGQQLFEPLAARLEAEPQLRVWCCLDIRRAPADTSLDSEIVRRFATDFAVRHWPWPRKPEVFYDPRSLEPHGRERSSLHAKCVVVDRRVALVTSANFTQAAQERNIECGIIVRYLPLVSRIQHYFESLCQTQQLKRCDLP